MNVLQWNDTWYNGVPLYPTSNQITDEATAKSIIQTNAGLCAGLGYTIDQVANDFSYLQYTSPADQITVRNSYIPADPLFKTPAHPMAGATPNLAPIARPAIGTATAGLFVWGQSNADRSGRYRYTASGLTYAYAGANQWYQLSDPIPGGADAGADAGPWPRVAEQLMGYPVDPRNPSGPIINRVIVRSCEVGGTSMVDWAPGGSEYQYLLNQIADCQANGVPITHLIYVQGEASLLSTQADWVNGFMGMLTGIRGKGVTAPIWVAQTTLCRLRDAANPPPNSALTRTPSDYVLMEKGQMTIRAAQQSIVTGVNIRAGANLDSIGPYQRGDGCHCDADASAALWVSALLAA